MKKLLAEFKAFAFSGSLLASHVREAVLRTILATILIIVALNLIL